MRNLWNFKWHTPKKVILLLVSISLFVACDPLSRLNFDPFGHHVGMWYVKNSTDKNIYLTLQPYNDYKLNCYVLPGDSVKINDIGFDPKDKKMPYFNRWIESIQYVVHSDEEIFLKVLSENDVVLQRWSYPDKDLPGKQLFKESSWRYYQYPRSEGSTNPFFAIWVFDILPEDIFSVPDAIL